MSEDSNISREIEPLRKAENFPTIHETITVVNTSAENDPVLSRVGDLLNEIYITPIQANSPLVFEVMDLLDSVKDKLPDEHKAGIYFKLAWSCSTTLSPQTEPLISKIIDIADKLDLNPNQKLMGYTRLLGSTNLSQTELLRKEMENISKQVPLANDKSTLERLLNYLTFAESNESNKLGEEVKQRLEQIKKHNTLGEPNSNTLSNKG